MAGRRTFGQIRKLPSGRYQARYQVDRSGHVVAAPTTFTRKADAESWLTRERVRLEAETSGAPRAVIRRAPALDDYAAAWLEGRGLRPTTRRTYGVYLSKHVLPALGGLTLDRITPETVRTWHANLAPNAPTARAHSYALLKAILASAVDDDLIPANPCRIRGAGTARVATEVVTAEPEQVAAMVDALPANLRLAVLIGAWGQLRSGETLALRRRDIDPDTGVVRVTRGVTWPGGDPVFGPPKTAAGVRAVHLPSAMLPAVRAHLAAHVPDDGDALLFESTPGRPVHPSWYARRVKAAAVTAGLPSTFRPHHLRHSGLTALASAGASVAELQRRAGHTTATMALRFQHGSDARDRALAERLTLG